jgi:hypothetical protein
MHHMHFSAPLPIAIYMHVMHSCPHQQRPTKTASLIWGAVDGLNDRPLSAAEGGHRQKG